jgi:hypothetical protein
MSAEEVANSFVNHFYSTLEAGNLAGLATLYQPQSTLTFEGTAVTGSDAILQKYSTVLPLRYDINGLTKEVQMSVNSSSMLIFVTGKLIIGGQGNFLLFSQCFQLVAVGPGQYYVHNDMFRLLYA